jgi:hypothetical protein
MPRIVPGSKASTWVPSADACRTRVARRDYMIERRRRERAAIKKAKAMPIGHQVDAVWRMLFGPPVRRRGILLACVPWSPDPSVLVATVRWPDGTTSRLDATLLVRVRVH